ncbi:hypothetical protein RV17_GL002161 [Enterococcus thailandicus]|nr:hypothetical protein RV17_GL002161 [Enterococcus thailandicus]
MQSIKRKNDFDQLEQANPFFRKKVPYNSPTLLLNIPKKTYLFFQKMLLRNNTF